MTPGFYRCIEPYLRISSTATESSWGYVAGVLGSIIYIFLYIWKGHLQKLRQDLITFGHLLTHWIILPKFSASSAFARPGHMYRKPMTRRRAFPVNTVVLSGAARQYRSKQLHSHLFIHNQALARSRAARDVEPGAKLISHSRRIVTSLRANVLYAHLDPRGRGRMQIAAELALL